MPDKPLEDRSIGYHLEDVERAQREYERGMAALHRIDNRGPIYSPPEMAEREAVLKADRDATVNAKMELTLTEVAEAERQLALLDARADDDEDGLTSDELARLPVHLQLAEQLLHMSVEQLIARIGLLVAGDDRPRIRANYRVLVDELARLDAAVPVNLTGSDVPPGHTERRDMLEQAARQLEAKRADPGIAKERDLQNKRIDQARKMRQQVNAATHDSRQADLRGRLVATGQYNPL